MEENTKLKKQYIAYIDILGYKDFFEKHPEEAYEFFNSIKNAVEEVKKIIRDIAIKKYDGIQIGVYTLKLDIKMKMFSDNILLLMDVQGGETEYARAISFILTVANIQRILFLEHEILVRGGVTIGDILFNEDFVFGKGLIDAVLLEENNKTPCILVSGDYISFLENKWNTYSSIFEKVKNIKQKQINKVGITLDEVDYLEDNRKIFLVNLLYNIAKEELIVSNPGEPFFINYLFDVAIDNLVNKAAALLIDHKDFSDGEKRNVVLEERYLTVLQKYKSVLEKKIQENCYYTNDDKSKAEKIKIKESIIRKHLWLLRQHDSVCEKIKAKDYMIKCLIEYDRDTLRMILKIVE